MSVSLQIPEYTCKLFKMINFSLTYEQRELFRLCKKNVIDIMQYFILDCPPPFKSHEHLMHLIVNLLTDNTNVKLTPKIGPRNSRYFYCNKGQ